MRIAFWTPWTPQGSGIADYSAALLHDLSRLCEIEVFVADACWQKPPEDDVTAYTVHAQSAFEERQRQQPFDLSIYQMGNHYEFHEGIYSQLLKRPGLLVLHDLSLFDFHYRGWWERMQQQAFLAELEYGNGQAGIKGFLNTLVGKAQTNLFEFDMSRRVIDSSLGVIVHSQAAYEQLTPRYQDKTVYRIYQGATVVRDDEPGRKIRARYGWRDEQFIIGIFGGLTPRKHIDIIIECFRDIQEQFPSARLVIVGRETDEPEYVRTIDKLIQQSPQPEAIIKVGEVPLTEFSAYIQAVDIVLNLRWPTVGETSATLMRALSAGKVVLISDIPQNDEYPEAFCWRVSTDKTLEHAQIRALLQFAATHREKTQELGQQAQTFVQANASWDRIAQQYANIAEQILAQNPQ